MSTRCVVEFYYKSEGKPVAMVYRHSDGYPDGECGVLADLERFFAAARKDTDDTRFNDPCYLAAKFVVWQAWENTRYSSTRYALMAKIKEKWPNITDAGLAYFLPRKRLDFLGVGILNEHPGDIEYVYKVICSGPNRPEVSYKAV